MVYKSNVGDYPLKAYPCEHWWVRYAVSCTYFSDKHGEMWNAYRKHIKLPEWDAHSGPYENREIWVGGTSDEYLLDQKSELYEKINKFIEWGDNVDEDVGWTTCPFENHDQSACPFYGIEEYYKDVSLEELRQRKGYNV